MKKDQVEITNCNSHKTNFNVRWINKKFFHKTIVLDLQNYQKKLGKKTILRFNSPTYNPCKKCRTDATKLEVKNAVKKRSYISCCIHIIISLTKNEIERLNWKEISSLHESSSCPLLENGKCKRYQDRPFKCKVFPYVLKEEEIVIHPFCSNPEYYAYYFFTHQEEILTLLKTEKIDSVFDDSIIFE